MLTIDAPVERLFQHAGVDCPPVRLSDVDGSFPRLPDGTWYLNGPGSTGRGSVRYSHWLDGDGLIRALSFRDGAITYASRFVRTRKYRSEQFAARAQFRTFGTAFAGDRLNDRGTGLESSANVSIVSWDHTLLALGEQGQPWQIDPRTLETLGPCTASGAITPVTPFAAHAKVDPATGEMFNFGVSFSPHRPLLNVFRFDACGRQLFRSRIPLHCSCTIHDFALGPTLAAFYVSPYVLDLADLRNGSTLMDALTWQPDLGSRIFLVSRATGELVASVRAGNRYCLHTINCFEAAGLLILDVLEMPEPVYDAYTIPRLFGRPIEAVPVRFCIDPVTQQVVSRRELPAACAPEFPVIDPHDTMRRYSRFWTLGISRQDHPGPKFFDRLVRFSWGEGADADVYQAPPAMFLGGEPLVIRDNAGDSWIVCQFLDTSTDSGGFAAFHAWDVSRGPVGRAWLQTPTPMAFHGLFVPAAKPPHAGAG